MITLEDLANKARKYDWILTEEEAIQVFILIPEGCIRELGIGNYGSFDRLIVKGLGDFQVMDFK